MRMKTTMSALGAVSGSYRVEFGFVALAHNLRKYIATDRTRSNSAAVASERRVHPRTVRQGEGSAGDKFRVSGTQETVEGAGANVPGIPQIIDLWGGAVSGVLSEASCWRCGATLVKKREADPF